MSNSVISRQMRIIELYRETLAGFSFSPAEKAEVEAKLAREENALKRYLTEYMNEGSPKKR